MEFSVLLSFLTAAVLLTIMPGPDNIFVLTQSITRGKLTGFLIALGLVSGVFVHTAIAATGLSIVLKQSEFAFNIILYLGAAYMLYLAYSATKEKPLQSNEKELKVSGVQLVKTGFFMNVLNPKVTLFFVAFLPQFVVEGGWPIALQFVFLGIVFIVQALLIFSLIAVLAGRLTQYLNSERFWKITKWTKVFILITLAIFLIV